MHAARAKEIRELANAEDTPKFMNGSRDLASFIRRHQDIETGKCKRNSSWFVVVHPNPAPKGNPFVRQLACFNVGQPRPTCYVVPD